MVLGLSSKNLPYHPITGSNPRKGQDIKVILISLEIMQMRIL